MFCLWALVTLPLLKMPSAPRAEEAGEERTAFFSQQPGAELDGVVECRVIHHAQNRAARACLGIGRAIDETGDTGVENGSGAHGTRLQRHVQSAAGDEPIIL